ncbi:MAG: YdcH family protein [Acidobacteria bacterium]|nr:YdcH family protein [Acidobacteriota bacterium]
MSTADAQELLRQDDGYRRLAEQHHELDDQLHALTERPYLSTSEQLEEASLKKRKLALKDQMEQIVRRYHAHSA